MKTNIKCYVVDFYLDGYYLKSTSLFQNQKIEVGEVIEIELPPMASMQGMVTGKVVDTLDVSEDEYHLYLARL